VRLRACPADQLCCCHGRRTQGTTLRKVQVDFRGKESSMASSPSLCVLCVLCVPCVTRDLISQGS
jgi:hypothetical protein